MAKSGNINIEDADDERLHLPDYAAYLPSSHSPPSFPPLDDRYFEQLLANKKRWFNWRDYYQKLIAFWNINIAREADAGSFFLSVPVFMAIGAVFYFNLPYEPSWAHIISIALCVFAAFIVVRDFYYLRMCAIFALICVSGSVLAKFETQRLDTPMLGSDVSTQMRGQIIEIEPRDRGGYRLILKVEATHAPQLSYGPEEVALNARSMPEGVNIGDTVEGWVRLRTVSGPLRQNGYDFSFYNYFRGIGAQGLFLGTPKLAVSDNPPDLSMRIIVAINQLRTTITTRIRDAIPGENGAIAAALITGQRGTISDYTNEALRQSGLAHVLSISGMHMAMICGIVLMASHFIIGLFYRFASRYPGYKLSALIAFIICSFYLSISGMDIAAVRSYIMVAIMLIAMMLGKQALTMRNLALAAIISIIAMPHTILTPSFQMSYAATAALIGGYGWWRDYKREKNKYSSAKNRGPVYNIVIKPFISTFFASILAGTASGLYAVWHFHNAAPLGILANLMAFAFIGTIVMPAGLIAVIVMGLNLEWLPLQIMGFGVELVRAIAVFVTNITPPIHPGNLSALTLCLWSVAFCMLVILRSKLRWLSVLPFIIGVIVQNFFVAVPTFLISEDSRMVAYLGPQSISVNVMRPNRFTLTNWQVAYNRQELRLPINWGTLPSDTTVEDTPLFQCDRNLCVLSTQDGALIAVASSADALKSACRNADFIVANFATEVTTCPTALQTPIVTRQQVAINGMATIYQKGDGFDVVYATNTERPWNRQRLWSRAARNL